MARKTADTGIPEKIDWEDDKSFTGYLHSIQRGLPSSYGEFDAATLVTEDGERKSTVLTVSLARGIDQVPLGARVWITYTGKTKLPNGNVVKNFDVDYDDEDKIEVPAPREVSAPAPAASTGDGSTPKATAYDEEPF